MPRSTLDVALRYAAGGRPVFPCVDKKPITAHGFKDATTNDVVIRRWWERWPEAQIATPTGAGLFVPDVDEPAPWPRWRPSTARYQRLSR
jgi:hypothetical protein